MSLIPGIAGQQSIFPDGMKVDHISEITVGAGVHIKGMSDGNTIPAGYIGETMESLLTQGSYQNSGTGGFFVFTNGPTVTLTAGKWVLHGHSSYSPGSSTSGSITLRFQNNTDGVQFGGGAVDSWNANEKTLHATGIINITSPKVIYLIGCGGFNGTFYMGSGAALPCPASIFAIRIA